MSDENYDGMIFRFCVIVLLLKSKTGTSLFHDVGFDQLYPYCIGISDKESMMRVLYTCTDLSKNTLYFGVGPVTLYSFVESYLSRDRL